MSADPIMLVVGTRPEGIKMAPVYFELQRAGVPVFVMATMQHDTLLNEVFQLFNIKPDYSCDLMRPGQDLFYITQAVLHKCKELFLKEKPSLVLVQGDTTSAMAAALAAFYCKIPVGHIEAGLRTDDIYAPFPEEMNRRVISTVARFHFAPTALAYNNLIRAGVSKDSLFLTGNTVVDALRMIKERITHEMVVVSNQLRTRVETCKKNKGLLVVLTMHRRESFNGGLVAILQAVRELLAAYPSIHLFYPYHPNPSVLDALEAVKLFSSSRVYMSEPISYTDMVYLLDQADLVLTDSGGIQEEAISLQKPVLVLRAKTERMEGVLVGAARIVGTEKAKIIDEVRSFIANRWSIECSATLYGDGYAAEAIVRILSQSDYALTDCPFSTQVDALNEKIDIVHEQIQKAMDMEKVAVIGLGYIGLPTALMLAQAGYDVIGVDTNTVRVERINSGDPDMHEPELYEKLQYVLGTKNFYATTRIECADFFILAVPTPITKDKKIDLSYVYSAARAIASVLREGNVVILESTVSVGTTDALAQFLQDATGLKVGVDFSVAHSPERVLPGNIFNELVSNDRVIGGINELSNQKVAALYKRFVSGAFHITDTKTAELVKLVENSARDTQIAFSHEVAGIAEHLGLDPYTVIGLVNKHPRVNLLNPTCGVGGHCIAVDPWFLIETFPEHTPLMYAARRINDARPAQIVDLIYKMIKEWRKKHTRQCTIALMGLTYKPNVDDMRESPALTVIRALISDTQLQVHIVEPNVKRHHVPEDVRSYVTAGPDALECADIVVFLVAHTRFKRIDMAALTENKLVIDVCGIVQGVTKKEVVPEGNRFFPAARTDIVHHADQELLNAFDTKESL